MALQSTTPGTEGDPRRKWNAGKPSSTAQPFGKFTPEAPLSDQPAFYEELQNKLRWALGSSYHVRYSSKKTPLAEYVRRIASAVVRDHGYYTD